MHALKIITSGLEEATDREVEGWHIFTPGQIVTDPRDDAEGSMGHTFTGLVSDFEDEYEVTVDTYSEGDQDGIHTIELQVADYDPERHGLDDVCGDLLARVIQYVRGDST